VTPEGDTPEEGTTKCDNKIMKLVPKKIWFYLFVNYNVVTFKVHSLSMHTPLPKVLILLVAFLEHRFWDVTEGLRYSPPDVFC
jgi:hypothetical protein